MTPWPGLSCFYSLSLRNSFSTASNELSTSSAPKRLPSPFSLKSGAPSPKGDILLNQTVQRVVHGGNVHGRNTLSNCSLALALPGSCPSILELTWTRTSGRLTLPASSSRLYTSG